MKSNGQEGRLEVNESVLTGEAEPVIRQTGDKLPTMLTLLFGVLMQAWQYSAISKAKSSLEEQAAFYSNMWLGLSAVLFLVCSGMTALAKLEIRLLADAAYYEAWQCVPILSAAMLLCAFTSFFGSVYTVTQRNGLSFRTSLHEDARQLYLCSKQRKPHRHDLRQR